MHTYILKDKKPFPADTDIWNRFMEDLRNRILRKDELPKGHHLSTVFLGIDHRFDMSEGPPILFETMVFDDKDASLTHERSCTWDEAIETHERMLEEWKGILNANG